MDVRPATTLDQDAVCNLWMQLLKIYNKSSTLELLNKSFRYAFENPDRIQVYVVTVNGAVAGTASLHLGKYSTWNDYFFATIEDVIIAPEYRGRGLAVYILQHLISVAEKMGLGRVELCALTGNRAARKLYEKVGFTSDSLLYEMPLPLKAESRQ